MNSSKISAAPLGLQKVSGSKGTGSTVSSSEVSAGPWMETSRRCALCAGDKTTVWHQFGSDLFACDLCLGCTRGEGCTKTAGHKDKCLKPKQAAGEAGACVRRSGTKKVCVKKITNVVRVGTTSSGVDSVDAAQQKSQMSAYFGRGFFGYEVPCAEDVAVEATAVQVAVPDAVTSAQAYAQACSFCPFSSRGGHVGGEWACESCIEDFSTVEERSEWAACIAAQAEQGGASEATSQVEAELPLPDYSAEIVNTAEFQWATQAESTDPQEPDLACTGRDFAAGSHANALGAVAGAACSFFCPFSSRGGQVSGQWACEPCVEDFSTAEERSEWAASIAAQAEPGDASGATSQEEARLLFSDDRAEIANPAEVQRATQAESTDTHEPVLACTGQDLVPGGHAHAVDITIITYSEPMYALGAAAGEPCSFCPINSRGGQAAGEAACESCIEDFSTAEQRSERATRTVAQTDQGGGKNTLSQEDEQTFVADARVMCVDADEVRMDSSPAQGQREAHSESTDLQAPDLPCTGLGGSHAGAADSVTPAPTVDKTCPTTMCLRSGEESSMLISGECVIPGPKVDDSQRTMIYASGEDEDEQPCLANARKMPVEVGEVLLKSTVAHAEMAIKIDVVTFEINRLASWSDARVVESAVESTNSDDAMGPASSVAACVPSAWTDVAEVAPSGQGPGRLKDDELPVTAEARPVRAPETALRANAASVHMADENVVVRWLPEALRTAVPVDQENEVKIKIKISLKEGCFKMIGPADGGKVKFVSLCTIVFAQEIVGAFAMKLPQGEMRQKLVGARSVPAQTRAARSQ